MASVEVKMEIMKRVTRAIAKHRKIKTILLIMVSTHIGYGSPKQDSFEVHGSPLKPEEVEHESFGVALDQDFYVPEEVLHHI